MPKDTAFVPDRHNKTSRNTSVVGTLVKLKRQGTIGINELIKMLVGRWSLFKKLFVHNIFLLTNTCKNACMSLNPEPRLMRASDDEFVFLNETHVVTTHPNRLYQGGSDEGSQ